MKKIKILYTITNFDTSGSGKVLYDLAKGLDPERFEVHIACANSKGDFFKEVDQLGVPIHFIRTAVKMRPYLTVLNRIKPVKKFIQSNEFDVVHSWHWSSDWTEAIGAKWGGAKFVYTKKAMTWGNIHWKLKSYLSDFIITINDEMRNFFPYKRNQSLIPLGLDTDYYSPAHFSSATSDKFKIITVANLVPVKGIEVLIDAVISLNNPNVELSILGDDRSDYAQDLKQKVKKSQNHHNIHFLGKHLDVRPFLSESDLYVIPTLDEGRKEGMPMALVEAMSMGVPVLGSDISGIRYVLKDFQECLFPVSNVVALADTIQKMITLESSKRNELGEKLRNYVLTHFTMQKFIEEHERLYTAMVQKK